MKTYELNTTYANYTVHVINAGSYANGRKAIRIVDVEDGAAVMTATVNMPDVDLKEGEIVIKDYSENEGCLHFLVANGVVSPAIRWADHGMPIVKLLVDLDDI